MKSSPSASAAEIRPWPRQCSWAPASNSTPDRIEAFVETGAIHLLVIAGLHMGILAGAVLLALRCLPISRRWALAAVAAMAVVYALLVDANPPVIRAAVLIVVICGAAWFGRPRWG